MSEKRFTLDELYCYVIQDNKKRLTDKQVVDLLNEQQSTIEQLQEENDALRYALKYVKHIEVDIDVDGVIDEE